MRLGVGLVFHPFYVGMVRLLVAISGNINNSLKLYKMEKKKVMEAYWRGWDEENDVYSKRIEAAVYDIPLLQRAYNIGRQHFMIGDDVTSIDNLTEEQILKIIYE